MRNDRQSRDVERLSGRRRDREQRAILWSELELLARRLREAFRSPEIIDEIASKVAIPPPRASTAEISNELREKIDIAFERHDQALETLKPGGTVYQLFNEVRIQDAILAAQDVIGGAHAVVEQEASDNAFAAIATEQTVRASEDSALASQITSLSATVGDNAAAIVSEQTARADADTAIASNVTTLTARVDGNDADIQDIQVVKVDANGAVAAVEQEISATYSGLTAMASSAFFAEATANKIEAGYVLRLNNENLLELVSVQDGVTSGPTSTLKLDSDFVTISGTLQAGNTSAGIIINTPDKENAVYVYQDAAFTYALYASNQLIGGGTSLMESAGGYTLQALCGSGFSSARWGPYVAIDAQNIATGGGKGQIGVGNAGGGYAFRANAGGYYDASGDGYLPFTGKHDGMILKSESYDLGDIVTDGPVVARTLSDAFTEFKISDRSEMRGVVGVLAKVFGQWYTPAAFIDHEATIAASDGFEHTPENPVPPTVMTQNVADYEDQFDLVAINSVGEGSVNVCGRGGDLEAGDLIVTSSLRGKGQRQSDDIVRSSTVAKAREGATFGSPDEVKQIACIYLCG